MDQCRTNIFRRLLTFYANSKVYLVKPRAALCQGSDLFWFPQGCDQVFRLRVCADPRKPARYYVSAKTKLKKKGKKGEIEGKTEKKNGK
jgi:hypothetical protein